MHISFDCTTQRHDRCNGLRIVGRTSLVAVCECLCHDHTQQDYWDAREERMKRRAEQLLTGQEA